jgi:outer membrane protein insertion porin family/translocation and assembly module TamA
VREGRPVVVHAVAIAGLPEALTKELGREIARNLRVGKPFTESGFDSATKKVKQRLGNLGYAYAKIVRDAAIDVHAHTADVTFTATPGPIARFGPVRIVGLGDLPEEPVRRALDLQEGAQYSDSALTAAQQALLDLTVFSAVEVTPQITDPPPEGAVVPIVVRVEPTRLRTLSLGGGLELDVFKTDVHGRVGWEHKNVFGGLEKLNVDLKPGVVLFPTRVPEFQPPQKPLLEEKLSAQLRKPGFLEPRTSGFIGGAFNVYPAILSYRYDPAQPVVGYVESRATAGVDRRFGKSFFASLSHVVQVSDPFAYLGELGTNPGALVVSYPRLFTSFDLRDNAIEPHAGFYADNELQVAGLGGQPRDLRVQPEARGYVPLGRKVTFALRATVGMLFPLNYNASSGGADSITESARDQQIIYFRGFFSGGPTSNRGYPLRGVGPQGTVQFLDSGIAAQQIRQHCDSPTSGDPACQVPLGGVTLWEASTELRFPILLPLSGVSFCDASDVSAAIADIRLTRPHFSCGLGLRYGTPIGPVRLDAGYRIPGLQILGQPDPVVYGALIPSFPMALQFGIGEAI